MFDRFPNTCLINGEHNSAWYKLAFDSPGQLVFSIEPYGTDDYDFALFDATGYTCADVASGDAPEVRCSYALTNGVPTGIDTGGTGITAWTNGPSFLLPLAVDSGDTYYLIIDNFTSNGQGFAIDFAGTTASMVSNDSFYVTSGYTTILPDTIKVDMFFNQTFYCATLSNDFSEFTLVDDMGDTLNILSVECDSAYSSITVSTAHPNHAVNEVTVHYQDGFDGNIIIAQCGGAEVEGTPKTFEARNGPGKLDFTYVQNMDTFSFTPIAHPTASLQWHVNDTLKAYGNLSYPYSSTFSQNTLYKVCLTADYGYLTDTVCKDFMVTGLYAVDALAAFQLYPNPANQEVSISLPYGAEWVEVTDISGKTVARYPASAANTSLVLGTGGWPQGLYLVRVATTHGLAVQKLQVIH